MTTGTDWQAQVARTWADNYALTDRSFAELTRRMLERIAEYGPRAVLDVGCGAGELALAIAHQHPAARVIGVDLSPDLIDAARLRGREQTGREQAERGQVGAEFVLADATSWALPGFSPDLIVSRHGVMFFDDPVAAFR